MIRAEYIAIGLREAVDGLDCIQRQSSDPWAQQMAEATKALALRYLLLEGVEEEE